METGREERDFVMAMLLERLGGEVTLTFREMLNFPPIQTWKIVREDFEDLSTKISLYKGSKMGTWPDTLRNEDARNEYAQFLGTYESPFAPYNEDKDEEYEETTNLRLATIEAWISNWTPRIQKMDEDINGILEALHQEVLLWKGHMKYSHGVDIILPEEEPQDCIAEGYSQMTYDCLNCNDSCDDCAYALGETIDKLEPAIPQVTINGITLKFSDELTAQDWVRNNA
jgi:hypothetical protein